MCLHKVRPDLSMMHWMAVVGLAVMAEVDQCLLSLAAAAAAVCGVAGQQQQQQQQAGWPCLAGLAGAWRGSLATRSLRLSD